MNETITKLIKNLEHDVKILNDIADEARMQGFKTTTEYLRAKAAGIEYAIAQLKNSEEN